MTSEQNGKEQESLGDFLRKTRLDRGLDVEQISNETKIPASIIRAIENDDHAMLPAPAFSRGFYQLYAKTLSIKQEELTKRCADIPNHPLNESKPQGPQHLKYDATNLAQKPPLPFFSIFSAVLVFLLILFAAASWFFSWNPAKFLSEQLRKLDESQPVIEQSDQQATAPSQTVETITTPKETDIVRPILENQQTAGITTETEPIQMGYKLEGRFTKQTDITITLDDGLPKKETVAAGEEKTWNAVQSIVIELQSTNGVTLTLNDDIPISLPPEKMATIAIPEYFFE